MYRSFSRLISVLTSTIRFVKPNLFILLKIKDSDKSSGK